MHRYIVIESGITAMVVQANDHAHAVQVYGDATGAVECGGESSVTVIKLHEVHTIADAPQEEPFSVDAARHFKLKTVLSCTEIMHD